jgi:hypothetical protein
MTSLISDISRKIFPHQDSKTSEIEAIEGTKSSNKVLTFCAPPVDIVDYISACSWQWQLVFVASGVLRPCLLSSVSGKERPLSIETKGHQVDN